MKTQSKTLTESWICKEKVNGYTVYQKTITEVKHRISIHKTEHDKWVAIDLDTFTIISDEYYSYKECVKDIESGLFDWSNLLIMGLNKERV